MHAAQLSMMQCILAHLENSRGFALILSYTDWRENTVEREGDVRLDAQGA